LSTANGTRSEGDVTVQKLERVRVAVSAAAMLTCAVALSGCVAVGVARAGVGAAGAVAGAAVGVAGEVAEGAVDMVTTSDEERAKDEADEGGDR
jgi:hypothetical protein